MSFEVPNPFLVEPTEDETLFRDAYNVISKEVDSMFDKGWKNSLMGKGNSSVKYYQGANIYLYLIFLAQATKTNLELATFLPNEKEARLAIINSLSCIEKNLPCLSTFFNTDYDQAWKNILDVFGIDLSADPSINIDCCLGIGMMIISDPDPCKVFVLGPCEEINIPLNGEFKPGQFDLTNMVKPLE